MVRRWRTTATLTMAALLAGGSLSACSRPSEFCSTVQEQFESVAPDVLSQSFSPDDAADLAARYAAIAAEAPPESKSAWSDVAAFWTDYAAAAGDPEALAALESRAQNLTESALLIDADVASCGLS